MLALRGQGQEAEDVFRSLLEAPVESAAQRGAQQQIRLLLVEHLLERRRLAEARLVVDSMLELDPHHADASAALARIDTDEGRLEAARLRLEALSKKHARPRYWTMLADSLERLGRNDLAEPWWQRAQAKYERDLARGDVGHLRELAELRLARGDTVGAFEAALRDLEEVRRDAESFETAAWALHQSGQSLEARQLVRVPLSLGADQPRLRERASAILRSGRSDGARLSP